VALSAKQRGVAAGMAAAAVVMAATLLAAACLLPAAWRPADPARALRWLALLPLPLAASIAALAKHRFFTPEDIDGSGLTEGTGRARRLQAVLQNTLEQTVLMALAAGSFALVAPAARLGVVPAAAILFLAGRMCFAYGYAGGAPSRAFGFALTFYPALALAVVSAGYLAASLA
jgi:hypothetical protein